MDDESIEPSQPARDGFGSHNASLVSDKFYENWHAERGGAQGKAAPRRFPDGAHCEDCGATVTESLSCVPLCGKHGAVSALDAMTVARIGRQDDKEDCWEFIKNPPTLASAGRLAWPGHLCSDALRRSLARFHGTETPLRRALGNAWPSPVGREAWHEDTADPRDHVPSTPVEFHAAIPFDGYERAGLALRLSVPPAPPVDGGLNEGRTRIELYGLLDEVWEDDGDQDVFALMVGPMLARVTGPLMDKDATGLLQAVNKWWKPFRGQRVSVGRPKGSTKPQQTVEEFLGTVRPHVEAFKARGVYPSQLAVAEAMYGEHYSDASKKLSRARSQAFPDWQAVLDALG